MQQQNDKAANNNKEKQNASQKEQQDINAPDKIKAAHEQADADIEQDADLSIHSPNDDLDEGETARLGEDKNDLV